MKSSRQISLAELAEEAGIPARTIRFYIAKGLLPGPASAGRGAVYTAEHVARLQQIKNLQAKGMMLAEIALASGREKTGRAAPSPSAWWNYAIADDVMVMVRAGASPWRLRQVRKAVSEMAAYLKKVGASGDENNAGE